MSIMSRIRAWGQLFGTTFLGDRNLYQVFGYNKSLEFEQLYFKYVRQDLAARIVEAEPHATWSAPPEVKGGAQFDTRWKDIIQKFDLFTKFSRLDKLVGIGEFAVMVIGIDDGQKLSQPVRKSRQGSQHNIIYLQPYSVRAAEITEYEQDPTNPRFGKPKMYRITPRADERSRGTFVKQGFFIQPFDVHYSRILHVAENCLEDDSFGHPRLLRVYNLLDDMLKTAGGAAETFWLTSNRGMQVDVDKEMDLKPEDAADLSDEVDEYFHNLRRVIRTKGVKITNLGSEVADPRGTFQVLIALISGATGIPQRILIGSEAGQLASAQDRANWATKIEERRSLFAEPTILKGFINKLVDMSVLEAPTNMTILWPDAFRQNPLERAQTSAQQARSLANVSKALSDSVPVVTPEEGRTIIGLKGAVPTFDTPNDAGSPGAVESGDGGGNGDRSGGNADSAVADATTEGSEG